MKMYSAAFAATILLILLILLLIWRIIYISLHPKRLFIHQTTTAITELLNPRKPSIHHLLLSRALPNERLIKAFALTNTFVSSDVGIHSAFGKRATSLLKAADERGWDHFQRIAIDSVEIALPDAGERGFDAFVQDVTMRVALVAILAIDKSVADLDSKDILVVSTHITQLWSLSKKPDPIPPELLPLLNHHLRRLIPDENPYPNPLDYIIPIWETMWRVVATLVVYAQNSPNMLSELHRSPSRAQFRHFDSQHPSPEWVVTEVMRLHPPSKRIARAFPIHLFPTFLPNLNQIATKLFGPLFRRESADIGKALRSECVWGVDADEFEPLRFHSDRLTPEQDMIKSLPFGCGRLKCVAASWAPMAAAIISAAILDRLQPGSEFQLVEGHSIGGREGWDGWRVVVTPS